MNSGRIATTPQIARETTLILVFHVKSAFEAVASCGLQVFHFYCDRYQLGAVYCFDVSAGGSVKRNFFGAADGVISGIFLFEYVARLVTVAERKRGALMGRLA